MNAFRTDQVVLSFLGLNELVPENLLAIFDENELEVIQLRVKMGYASNINFLQLSTRITV